MSAADWPDGPLEASASAARDGRSQLCPTAGRESTYGRTTLLIHHVGPAAVVYGPRYTGGIRELYQQLKRFQVRPAADRHSVCLADRPVRAGHDRQGQREQRAIAPLPDRQPGGVRLLRPHDGGGCAQSLGMKDAFVPSSVLRLRRRLSEDKMINIDIADVLFAGMVFPVMKFVKKIVLPRVRKAWEKVKEVAKKMACTEAPPVSDLESQSESNGSTDDLDHA